MGCAASSKSVPEDSPELNRKVVTTVRTANDQKITTTNNWTGNGQPKNGNNNSLQNGPKAATNYNKSYYHARPKTAGGGAGEKASTTPALHNGPANKKVARARARFDPRILAKYDIKALIGKGSFSRVVRVENRHTKQPYAIKMIDIKHGKDVYETELNVLKRVRHNFIVQLIEVYETSEKVYMVMELATGGELFDRIVSKGSFTEKDATRVMTMVLDGVRYLHSLGIAHRDLKPENLLYYHPGNDSKILITDFGLASARNSLGDWHMKTTCGTPEYLAPEIITRKSYTCAVDCWAIGVITYILLSGMMPFDEENRTKLFRKIIRGQCSFTGPHWTDVSEMAKNFIKKLLMQNPAERMTAGQGLVHPWIMGRGSTANMKNLHGSISSNLLKRSSYKSHSTKSNQSNRSIASARSQQKRLQRNELDVFAKLISREEEMQRQLEKADSISNGSTGSGIR